MKERPRGLSNPLGVMVMLITPVEREECCTHDNGYPQRHNSQSRKSVTLWLTVSLPAVAEHEYWPSSDIWRSVMLRIRSLPVDSRENLVVMATGEEPLNQFTSAPLGVTEQLRFTERPTRPHRSGCCIPTVGRPVSVGEVGECCHSEPHPLILYTLQVIMV